MLLNKMDLFGAGELFDGVLPAHGFFFRIKIFHMQKLHRPACFGVLGACACVVGFDPVVYVVGPACVKSAVTAKQDVGTRPFFDCCHN